MWALNTYFFAVIFCAIRTGDLWTIIPIAIVYAVLHTTLEHLEQESEYGTDYYTERPTSSGNHTMDRLLDDTDNNMDNTKT